MLGGAEHGKAIIILNPAEPPLIMRDTVFTLSQGGSTEAIEQSILDMVAEVQKYVPGYRLKQKVQFEHIGDNAPVRIPGVGPCSGLKTTILLEVEGAAHYLPAYAGNLDIMTSAALITADHWAAKQVQGVRVMARINPNKLYVQDVTLRDGMHSIRHNTISTLCAPSPARWTRAKVDAIEITHGDGITGSTFNYGFGAHDDDEWIAAVAGECTHARVTVLLLPGIGTVHDLKHAYDAGARSVRVATHCTEADVSRQHIEAGRNIGMDTVGFLMMAHMIEPEKLVEQALLMESYGAECVYVTDCAGALLPDQYAERVKAVRDALKPETEIGVHTHHNLTLGVANAVAGIDAGAVRVDASLAGMGAGAGNAPLEALDRGARSHGRRDRLRPAHADGRGGRPRAPLAGPPGARRSQIAVARLCRRLFELPAPRGKRVKALRRRYARHPDRTGQAPHGRRPGGHDHRRRPRHSETA